MPIPPSVKNIVAHSSPRYALGVLSLVALPLSATGSGLAPSTRVLNLLHAVQHLIAP